MYYLKNIYIIGEGPDLMEWPIESVGSGMKIVRGIKYLSVGLL